VDMDVEDRRSGGLAGDIIEDTHQVMTRHCSTTDVIK
jgi:hypothetical protein